MARVANRLVATDEHDAPFVLFGNRIVDAPLRVARR
jgi:hypothetical protein